MPLLLLLLSGVRCRQEIVPDSYQPTHAHDAYTHSLRQAALADTALGRDWMSAAQDVLRNPVNVQLPFSEVFYVNPSAAFAVAYGFSVRGGQRIEVEVEVQASPGGRLFIDLFRVTEGPEQWLLVASAGEAETRLEFEPRRDNTYVVRLQPELLRGGQYKVTLRKVPALAFPVKGGNSRAIWSGFGEQRDGGRRKHHGIDIFAPRHTPVLAPSRAYVRRIADTGAGGRVVWLYDPKRSLHLYFAHLQTQDIRSNIWVDTGQLIGTVGNSGNARTTRPHLHFGIYSRGTGPVDPHYYVAETRTEPAPISANTEVLGRWMRSSVEPVPLRASWGATRGESPSLERHLPLMVLAATRNLYRVRLPDGASGYVPARSLEMTDGVLRQERASAVATVKDAPARDAAAMQLLGVGEEYSVIGRFGEHWFVRTSRGSTGWLLAY
ncbi:MAG: M23 family metallopeptidase [Acidobacteriota bacterium]